MPNPVKPTEICATVPSATSSLCDRIQKVFLQLPALLCRFWEWAFNSDGTLTDAFIREVAAFPVGVVLFRLSSTVPVGWLACSGQEVSRTTYAELFAVIGTTYGVGNGTTTFNVPQMKRKFIVGYDPADAAMRIGDTGGEEAHTLTTSELPTHTHPFAPELSGDASPPSLTRLTAGNSSSTLGTGTFTTGSAGSGVAHNTRPPFLCGNYIIRY
jgi:microcystin-dependent protein